MLYEQYQDDLSLRAFCKLTGYPRYQLRYYLKTIAKRQKRQEKRLEEAQKVKDTALKHKTYGYRRIYVELNKVYCIGREKVRRLMKVLSLQKELPRKKRKASPEVSTVCDLPEGRKVQIDATRFELKDGIAWKYVVEDVASRSCLAIESFRQLSKESAAATLVKAQHRLSQLGIDEQLVVQSDGGSDFTSQYFQETCSSLQALWRRCRVSEKGGMAILERLNRTLKYEYFFWHEPETLDELTALDKDFYTWYNYERIHSSINYLTPWQKLLEDATLS